jgi:hypothetical protein
MQQLTNAEEQLMEHLWNLRKHERFTRIISRTKAQDHYRGHFTETMIDKDFVPTLSLVTQRILSISKKTAYFSKRQRIDKEFL